MQLLKGLKIGTLHSTIYVSLDKWKKSKINSKDLECHSLGYRKTKMCADKTTQVWIKNEKKKKCIKPLTCIIRGLMNKFANKSLEYNR